MKSSHLYKYHYDFIIQYDLINVFQHKKLEKNLPKIQKLILSFNKTHSTNFFNTYTLSQLLTKTKGNMKILTLSSNNLKGKTKQKTILNTHELRKDLLFLFFSKLYKDLFSKKQLKINTYLKKFNTKKINKISYKINKPILLEVVKNNYNLFKKLETSTNISLDIIFNSKENEKLLFLTNSYKLIQFKQ